MKWAVGLTTISDRMTTTLPRTLASLRCGGFTIDRLFVDGSHDGFAHFEIPISYRYPRVRPWANFIMGLQETYLRNPLADLYAMFQDDVVCSRNLREYIERKHCPEKGYMNLYTFPSVQKYAPAGTTEWYETKQLGRGGVGLIFTNEGVRALLGANHGINRARDANRGWRAVDGGVVDSMKEKGFREYCHNPSLTQHIGSESSLHKLMIEVMKVETDIQWTRCHPPSQALAESFRGEEFDLLTLL